MPGQMMWGYYPTDNTWVPLKLDSDGSIHVVGYVDNLDDIGDVSVAAPTDGYVLYWDAATSLWKAKAIPSGAWADITGKPTAPSLEELATEHDASGLHAGMVLNNIGDVSVPTPGDQYFVYRDAATSLWKCRALVDADIPAAICRDSELATHAALPDVHHATHLKTLADHPLTIIPTMDDAHIPAAIARDAEVTAEIATHTAIPAAHHVKYTDAEALAAAVLAGAIQDAETKAPTHDAVFDVKATADAAIAKALLTERGSVIFRDATVPAELLHGTAGQVLTSGGHDADPSWAAAAGGGPTIVRKTADQTVTNSTVLVDDAHLLFAMAANEVWQFKLVLLATVTAVAGLKGAFLVPGGASIRWQSINYSATSEIRAAHSVTNNEGLPLTSAAYAKHIVVVDGIAICGATAGNLQFRWAQNTAEATNTQVFTNSCLIAHKLA